MIDQPRQPISDLHRHLMDDCIGEQHDEAWSHTLAAAAAGHQVTPLDPTMAVEVVRNDTCEVVVIGE